MAIGNQPSTGSINGSLTSMALDIRNWANQVLEEQEEITGLGVAGLEALGYSSGDAASVVAMYSYMSTIAGIYKGLVTQGSLFNFDNALSVLWAGG